MSTAILVDVAFFLKRFRHVYPMLNQNDPDVVGKTLYSMCMMHVDDRELYRILVYAGDGDFVPAAKLARREGIDVVLDPIWSPHIGEALHEHIDGLKSTAPRPDGYF